MYVVHVHCVCQEEKKCVRALPESRHRATLTPGSLPFKSSKVIWPQSIRLVLGLGNRVGLCFGRADVGIGVSSSSQCTTTDGSL